MHRNLRKSIAPGARVLIRGEEWIVRTVIPADVGGYQLECVGVSELVRDRDAIFLTLIDQVEPLDPEDTTLVPDTSPEYQASILYLEALLRQSVPTGGRIVMGHRGAMDPLPYQLDPTRMALGQPRQRILIADTVGLGKTLEAGILVSELMRRGKGRRILVVTVKSMMLQFQKELWSRFTIPLTRLDSAGIQRIRQRIPANHNPFHYHDKTIISVDTLKRDAEYRHYLEHAYWDIIVIDECHNVSFKGNRTQSNRLARLLAGRSDSLILLSATPHNGRKESFASLMRMLNPTTIPHDGDYNREEIKGLFVRRFKNDVRDQIAREFPERKVLRLRAEATPEEEHAFDLLADLRLANEESSSGGLLFRTTLEKSLFSSPGACLQTLDERIRKQTAKSGDHQDLPLLKELREAVAAIDAAHFSKYQRLIKALKEPGELQWNGSDPHDRLVIFTERIETLKFLQTNFPKALGLKDNAVAILHGQLPDKEQNDIVEAFGQLLSPLRLLIASDVASEGINLHFLSHRLIHFDIPWSLMVFQQRNGRVDRYGQEQPPLITYLMTDSRIAAIRGDMRILEILTQKDEQAAHNIGDPSAFLGEYDVEAEELKVGKAMEAGIEADAFAATLDGNEGSLLDLLLLDDVAPPVGEAAEEAIETYPSLFADDFAYLRAGFRHLHRRGVDIPFQEDNAARRIELQPPADLDEFLKRTLPREMRPESNHYVLTVDSRTMQRAIRDAHQSSESWPAVQYLWPLHPMSQWLNYKCLATFGRRQAPVIRTPHGLNAGEFLFLISALIPNRKGQPVLNDWFGILCRGKEMDTTLSFPEVIGLTRLGQAPYPNTGVPVDTAPMQRLLPAAVEAARKHMTTRVREFDTVMRAKLDEELQALKKLKGKHEEQLEFRFATRQPEALILSRKQQEAREIEQIFNEYREWMEKTLAIEDRPHITVAAVLHG